MTFGSDTMEKGSFRYEWYGIEWGEGYVDGMGEGIKEPDIIDSPDPKFETLKDADERLEAGNAKKGKKEGNIVDQVLEEH